MDLFFLMEHFRMTCSNAEFMCRFAKAQIGSNLSSSVYIYPACVWIVCTKLEKKTRLLSSSGVALGSTSCFCRFRLPTHSRYLYMYYSNFVYIALACPDHAKSKNNSSMSTCFSTCNTKIWGNFLEFVGVNTTGCCHKVKTMPFSVNSHRSVSRWTT